MSWSLLRVEVVNIGGIFGRKEYGFGRGINVVAGPNDVGKTSLIRAIVWGLTGQSDVKLEELLNRRAERGGVVVLVEKKGDRIKIRRTLTRKRGKVHSDYCSVEIIAPEGRVKLQKEGAPKDVAPLIGRELDVDLAPAFYSMYSGARDELLVNLREGGRLRDYVAKASGATFFDIAAKGAKECESVLRKRWEKLLKETRDKAGSEEVLERVEKEIDEERARLNRSRRDLESLKMEIDSISGEIEELDGISKQLETIEGEIEKKEERVNALAIYMKEAAEEVKQSEVKVKSYRERMAEMETELRALENERESVEEEINLVESEVSGIRGKAKKLEGELSGLRSQREVITKVQRYEGEIDGINRRMNEVIRKLNDLKKEGVNIENRLEENRRRQREVAMLSSIEDLGAFGILISWIERSRDKCPVCSRVWDEEMLKHSVNDLKLRKEREREEMSELLSEIEKLENKLRVVNSEVERLEEKHKDLEREKQYISSELEELRVKVAASTLGDLEKQISDLEAEIRNESSKLKKQEDRIRRLRGMWRELLSKIGRLERERVKVEESMKITSKHVAELKGKIRRWNDERRETLKVLSQLRDRKSKLLASYDEERHENLRRKLLDLKAEVKSLTSRVSDLEGKLERLEKERRRYLMDVEAYRRVKREEEVYEKAYRLQKIISDRLKAFSEKLREETRMKINEMTPKILSELGYVGFDVARITDEYEFDIRRSGVNMTLDTLSEGARNILGISIKLAILKTPIICFDDCIKLDSVRLSRLEGFLKKVGVSVVMTERRETPLNEIVVSQR